MKCVLTGPNNPSALRFHAAPGGGCLLEQFRHAQLIQTDRSRDGRRSCVFLDREPVQGEVQFVHKRSRNFRSGGLCREFAP